MSFSNGWKRLTGRVIDMKGDYFKLCPRCKRWVDMKHPALSRADNKTNVCSRCGSEEAIEQMNGILETSWLGGKNET